MSSNPDLDLLNLEPVPLEYRDIKEGQGLLSRSLPDTAASQAGQQTSETRYTEEQMAQLLAKARAEGLSEGVARARAENEAKLAKAQEQMAQSVVQFKKERDDYYARVEPELVKLALGIAGKILHREAFPSPSEFLY